MLVDGVKLLELVKDNKFEDGDEIKPQITTNDIYIYSAYYRNFTNKKTGNQLTVQEYIFWSFNIPQKLKNKDDIEELEETGLYNIESIIVNREKINEIIRKVNKINKEKIK